MTANHDTHNENAEPVKVPSEDMPPLDDRAAYSAEHVRQLIRRDRSRYGQPARPANTPPVGALNPELTLKGLIHKIEVAGNPNQGAVPWFMCSLLQQALPHLRMLDAQPAASAEPAGTGFVPVAASVLRTLAEPGLIKRTLGKFSPALAKKMGFTPEEEKAIEALYLAFGESFDYPCTAPTPPAAGKAQEVNNAETST